MQQEAEYNACMTFCLDEHNFSYCNPICDGSASSAGTVGESGDTGGKESAVPAYTASSCGTDERTETAIWVSLMDKLGPSMMTIDPISATSKPRDDDCNNLEISFKKYGSDECYIVTIIVNDACQIFVMEEFECTQP